jgi:hypothetical protein
VCGATPAVASADPSWTRGSIQTILVNALAPGHRELIGPVFRDATRVQRVSRIILSRRPSGPHPGSGWSREVAAELVCLFEIVFDQVRCGGRRGVEVDVLDVLDAREAEAPVVDDLANGVADARATFSVSTLMRLFLLSRALQRLSLTLARVT